MICSLGGMIELDRHDIYIENKVKEFSNRYSIGNFGVHAQETANEMDNRLIFLPNFNDLCLCACYGK